MLPNPERAPWPLVVGWDGRRSRFDPERLQMALAGALTRSGEGSPSAAADLAETVARFLGRPEAPSSLTVDELVHLVRRALEGTGHVRAARCFGRPAPGRGRTAGEARMAPSVHDGGHRLHGLLGDRAAADPAGAQLVRDVLARASQSGTDGERPLARAVLSRHAALEILPEPVSRAQAAGRIDLADTIGSIRMASLVVHPGWWAAAAGPRGAPTARLGASLRRLAAAVRHQILVPWQGPAWDPAAALELDWALDTPEAGATVAVVVPGDREDLAAGLVASFAGGGPGRLQLAAHGPRFAPGIVAAWIEHPERVVLTRLPPRPGLVTAEGTVDLAAGVPAPGDVEGWLDAAAEAAGLAASGLAAWEAMVPAHGPRETAEEASGRWAPAAWRVVVGGLARAERGLFGAGGADAERRDDLRVALFDRLRAAALRRARAAGRELVPCLDERDEARAAAGRSPRDAGRRCAERRGLLGLSGHLPIPVPDDEPAARAAFLAGFLDVSPVPADPATCA